MPRKEDQNGCPLYPQGDGTRTKVAVGGRIPPVAGRKLRTGGKPLGGLRMRGTVTATGRTFAVAVPTLRRDEPETARNNTAARGRAKNPRETGLCPHGHV